MPLHPIKSLISVILSVMFVLLGIPLQTSFQAQAQATNKTIAVVEFANLTGETKFDYLKSGLAESLSTKLARYKELTVVERGKLNDAIKELGFAQSIYADSQSAAQLGKMLGANAIVSGSIIKAGSKFEINVRMVNVETSQIVVSEGAVFNSEDDILGVVNYLSLRIPHALGGIDVDIDALYKAKQALKTTDTPTVSGGDNGWIIWAVIGGVVVVGTIVAVVVLAGGGTKVNQQVCVGANCPPVGGIQPVPNQPVPNQPVPNQPVPNQPVPNQPAPSIPPPNIPLMQF